MLPRQPALIIVQNLPVPLDRRLWLECQALRDSAESSEVATFARTHAGPVGSVTVSWLPTTYRLRAGLPRMPVGWVTAYLREVMVRDGSEVIAITVYNAFSFCQYRSRSLSRHASNMTRMASVKRRGAGKGQVQNVDAASMLNADLIPGNATNTEPK